MTETNDNEVCDRRSLQLVEQTYLSVLIVTSVLGGNRDLRIIQSKKNEDSGYWDYAKHFTYNAAGAVTSLQLGNGQWQSNQFNSRMQMTAAYLGSTQNGSNLLKLDFDYGSSQNNGNLLSQVITVPTVGVESGFSATQNYTYDSLNRLKTANEVIGSTETWKQSFVFDRYGNRNFDEANTTTLPKSCLDGGNPVVCTADRKIFNPSVNQNNNRLNTSEDYSCDPSGNTTNDPQGRVFKYDGENKQYEVRNSSNETIGQYFFDGNGKRVKKVVPSTEEVTVFVYDAMDKLVAEYSTQVESVENAKVAYLTNDHLGSPRINTDRDGNVTSRRDFHPFGEEIHTAQRTTALAYDADTVRKQFTGYERDTETDLDFAQARMHSYNLGRFSSPDPLMASAVVSDPQTWNRYSYAFNNPLKLNDPTGLKPEFVWREFDKLTAEEQRIFNKSKIVVDKGKAPIEGKELYERLKTVDGGKQLAGILNMTAALSNITFGDGRSAISYVRDLTGYKKGERIYANVDAELKTQMDSISSEKASDKRFIGPRGQDVEHKNDETGVVYDVTYRENEDRGQIQLSFAISEKFGALDMDADERGKDCIGCNNAANVLRAINGANPVNIYNAFISRPSGKTIQPSYGIKKK
ncbi:MAG: RHS repeat-associated core domain-containing protein [Acidobacteriota bacterium]|nr:MAG: RHS repeat-associated core domain-containing protein [Acidobacteriota bacterium]